MGLFTKDIKNMDDLFLHTLRDIYYAEKQIVKALPEMIEKSADPQLKQGFKTHLNETEPAAHLATLNRLTEPGARALLVMPVADCLSRRLLGGWWPHDIKDHWVFYSTAGLTRLWRAHGWRLASTFHPSKYISGLTIARHLQHKTGVPLPAAPLRSTAVWLNFGERGLIFEKC